MLPFVLMLAVFALNFWVFKRYITEEVSTVISLGLGVIFLTYAVTGQFWPNFMFAVFGLSLGARQLYKLIVK